MKKKNIFRKTALFLSLILMLSLMGCSEKVDALTDIAESVNTKTSAIIESEDVVAELNNVMFGDYAENAAEKNIEVPSVDGNSTMEVHFIDVGQGNATLIKQNGHYMLIDAGDNSKGTAVQNYLNKQGVKTLDYLILTHPHADHIGGADVVITKFDCNTILMTDVTADTATYRDVVSAMEAKSITAVKPEVDTTYQLGDAVFQIIAPNRDYKDDLNNGSIGLIIRYGEKSFLFTGDGEADMETDICNNGLNIDADVSLLGHHGSNTSTTVNYLNKVSPTDVVISCGENNDYGHPHAETLNLLRSSGINVRRTDEQGSIIATTDGFDINWSTPISESWQSGR